MNAHRQGAIVIFGILPLFDFNECIYLWRVSKFDWLVWMTGLLITSFAGVEYGILASVALSVALVRTRVTLLHLFSAPLPSPAPPLPPPPPLLSSSSS